MKYAVRMPRRLGGSHFLSGTHRLTVCVRGSLRLLRRIQPLWLPEPPALPGQAILHEQPAEVSPIESDTEDSDEALTPDAETTLPNHPDMLSRRWVPESPD